MWKVLGVPESSILAFYLAWLLLLSPLYVDGEQRQQQQQQQDVDLADRSLGSWGGGGGIRDNVRIGNRRGDSSRSRYTPKYGRRYHTSPSKDGITTSDNHKRGNSNFQKYEEYYAYYYEPRSSDPSDKMGPCRKSKGEKKNQSGRKHKYKDSKSRIKTKSSKSKGSKGRKLGWSKSKSKSGKGSNYFEYEECQDSNEGVEEIICSGDVQDFVSSVVVVFNGYPQFLTAPEQIALETSFEDTYNQLTFANCDGLFRRIESVRGFSYCASVFNMMCFSSCIQSFWTGISICFGGTSEKTPKSKSNPVRYRRGLGRI
jgi:hypothetical protein